VSTLQRYVLLLEVSTPQKPVLLLEVSTPQRSVLLLEVSTHAGACAATGGVYITEVCTAPGMEIHRICNCEQLQANVRYLVGKI
jgi:hypothetical protein